MKASLYSEINILGFAAFVLMSYISAITVWWISPVFILLAVLTFIELGRVMHRGLGNVTVREMNR